MLPSAYRSLLKRRELRHLIVLGMVARIPISAAGLVLTYHIVNALGHSYSAAGAVVAAYTVGSGLGAPWRGRLLDRAGLRHVLVPSIVVQALAWPALGYLPFLALFPVVVLAGLFAIPTFSVVRKALSVMVPTGERRSAFALDAVCVELVFMVGPAIGVWTASVLGSAPVLVALGVLTAGAGMLLWWVNPTLVSSDDSSKPQPPTGQEGTAEHARIREWMSTEIAVVLAVSLAAAVALTGTDLGILAIVRELGVPHLLGVAITVWCASSAVGGLVYGSLHRSVSPTALALLLGAGTLALMAATSIPMLFVLLVVGGFACAPLMAATGDALARLVPEQYRGEAMGWQGTAFTVGSAVGAPIAGIAIDQTGAAGGFAVVGILAIAVAGLGAIVQARARSVERS